MIYSLELLCWFNEVLYVTQQTQVSNSNADCCSEVTTTQEASASCSLQVHLPLLGKPSDNLLWGGQSSGGKDLHIYKLLLFIYPLNLTKREASIWFQLIFCRTSKAASVLDSLVLLLATLCLKKKGGCKQICAASLWLVSIFPNNARFCLNYIRRFLSFSLEIR